jgi:hypothetical protein
VLGDVGQPQHVRSVDREVALDEVLFGRLVHEVLLVPLRAREPVDPELMID